MHDPDHWAIGLRSRPTAVQLGVGLHGRPPVETYSMLEFWSVHLYSYHARLRVNDNWYEIAPGSVSVFAPDANVEYRYLGPSEHLYAHFRMPVSPLLPPARIPVHQQVERPAFERLTDGLRDAIAWFPVNPDRAEVRLWDLLWSITATGAAPGDTPVHPAINQVMRIIEFELGTPLVVGTLARRVGISPNHLTRLFRAHTGQSPVEFIRARRVERARHLLQATSLPIKTVAHQVGIRDLHLFNKTIRRVLGISPRRVRAGELTTG